MLFFPITCNMMFLMPLSDCCIFMHKKNTLFEGVLFVGFSEDYLMRIRKILHTPLRFYAQPRSRLGLPMQFKIDGCKNMGISTEERGWKSFLLMNRISDAQGMGSTNQWRCSKNQSVASWFRNGRQPCWPMLFR